MSVVYCVVITSVLIFFCEKKIDPSHTNLGHHMFLKDRNELELYLDRKQNKKMFSFLNMLTM